MIKHGVFNTRRGKAHYYNDNQNNKNKNKRTLQRKKAQVYLGFFYAQTKFVSLRSVANNERRWCFKILGQCFEI